MKLSLEPTDTIVEWEVDGQAVPVRIWTGTDDQGVPIQALIASVSPQTHDEEVRQRFAARLRDIGFVKVVHKAIDIRLVT